MKKKVLLTGANGYIGLRLLPVLVDMDYHVVCAVRDKARFFPNKSIDKTAYSVIEIDILKLNTLENIPKDIDAAYYLVHSMRSSVNAYDNLEALAANNFKTAIEKTKAKQVIFLSGITNKAKLSKHLNSRKKVELILSEGRYALTTFRAGIIVGSGSASFEIIRDLVEKLPFMIAPKWVCTLSQPIAIRNVIEYLTKSLLKDFTYNNNYDIGGPEVLSYKQMLLQFASYRKLNRTIIALPFFSPKLSSYWLYFITSVSYNLAINLVASMKIDVTCRPHNLNKKLNITPIFYNEALQLAFQKIDQNEIVSSWKTAFLESKVLDKIDDKISLPTNGCFKEVREVLHQDRAKVTERIWQIGGATGWYYGNWMWKVRGFIDRMVGGTGLRRGRVDQHNIKPGDALDFWRVLQANKEDGKLLLYAEMKLPGEAWLAFSINDKTLTQTAIFRPKGLWGRIYWYALYPIHKIIFSNMTRKIATF